MSIVTSESNLPSMYKPNDLVDLDQSDLATRRLYVIQGNSRLRNIAEGAKLGDVFVATSPEDPIAERVGGVDDPFTLYVLAVSKGVVQIDKENNGRLTFLTGQPDAEDRLRARERDIWRSYHYVVKVTGVDDPVSLMLTGFSGLKTAQDLNTMVANRIKSGLDHVTPVIIKSVLKSNGTNTWGTLKPFPTLGDADELAAAQQLVADGIDRMQYRQAEVEAPAEQGPGF